MALIEAHGEQLLIDNRLIYSEIPGAPEKLHGLLMNARFVQGIFDDRADPTRFSRFGKIWDPEQNTDNLIRALPEWYSYGLRAITVGLQGGMPVFTIKNSTIDNNPFSDDGMRVDSKYLARLDRLVRAADSIGMVVIVSILYEGQSTRMRDGRTIRNAVSTVSRFLREQQYGNVIIEVANEHNVGEFRNHPIVHSGEGIASLIDLARRESGGMLTTASGGYSKPIAFLSDVELQAIREVSEASDVIMIHGNGLTRQGYYELIEFVRGFGLERPIICNEDSPCVSRLEVAADTRTSWGYYNNLTKQEPPTDWGITTGEDLFFARRVARTVGIHLEELPESEQIYFQGFESEIHDSGRRWLRVASEFPEKIDRVNFYSNKVHVYSAYDEPFMLHYRTTWIQDPVLVDMENDRWEAEIVLVSGKVVHLKQ
jgi:hypothetical protein